MKKLFAIVLLLVYGATSSGMTLHLHYCCGKLDKIDLAPVKHRGCGTEHTLGKKSCCDNKELSFTLKADQNTVKLLVAAFQPAAIKPVPAEFQALGSIETKGSAPQIFTPPPLEKDLNTLFCIYRI